MEVLLRQKEMNMLWKKIIGKSADYQCFVRLNPAIGSTLAEPKKVSLTSEKMCSNFTYGKPRIDLVPKSSKPCCKFVACDY